MTAVVGAFSLLNGIKWTKIKKYDIIFKKNINLFTFLSL